MSASASGRDLLNPTRLQVGPQLRDRGLKVLEPTVQLPEKGCQVLAFTMKPFDERFLRHPKSRIKHEEFRAPTIVAPGTEDNCILQHANAAQLNALRAESRRPPRVCNVGASITRIGNLGHFGVYRSIIARKRNPPKKV